jgi:hypothetical protein
VVPDSSIATSVENLIKEGASKDAVDVTETPIPELPTTKTTGKGAIEQAMQSDSPPLNSSNPDAPRLPKADTVKDDAKTNLSLNPSVSTWSLTPEPPKKIIATECITENTGQASAATAPNDALESLKSRTKRSMEPRMIAAPYPSVSEKVGLNMSDKSNTLAASKDPSSHELLPPLEPFTHATFSCFSNIDDQLSSKLTFTNPFDSS